MLDEDSYSKEYYGIRACIIPTESIKIIKLQLGPEENGLVVDYETKPEELTQKSKSKPTYWEDSKVAPITMRKYLLYMQSRAG